MDAGHGEPMVGWGRAGLLCPFCYVTHALHCHSQPSPALATYPWLLKPLQARAGPCRTAPCLPHHLPPLMLSFWADAGSISLWQQGAAGL